MDHRQMFKAGGSTVDDLRSKRRTEEADSRKTRRQRTINSKRVRLGSEGEHDEDITTEQVQHVARRFVRKDGDKMEQLKFFQKAFAQGTLLTETFLKEDNSLSTLVGHLTGSDAELQLQAAWCLTNMAAGTDDQAQAVLNAAGAYLVTYLTSGNIPLQYQCSWAIGNLAGDGPVCRDVLQSQGALPPLISHLQSDMNHVVQSAAFALSNMSRGPGANTELMVDLGLLPNLIPNLTYNSERLEVIAEAAWVLTYLAACGEHDHVLKDCGAVQQVSALLIALAQNHPEDYKVFTPTLRCLGNMCSANDELTELACMNPNLIPALGKCLTSNQRHIKKETLWVISNITGTPHVANMVVTNGLLSLIIQFLDSTFDLKQDAAYAVCNIASHSKQLCEETVQQGALLNMIPLLKSPDPDLANMGLSYAEMVLRELPNGKFLFEEAKGLEGLEVLEYHNNESLREQTTDILDKYFYNTDVMEDDER